MPRTIDPATREALAERLRFYRDLGLTDFYRRDAGPMVESDELEPVAAAPVAASTARESTTIAQPQPLTSSVSPNFFGEELAIKTRKTFQAPPEIGGVVPSEERAAALQIIRDEIGDCTRCALHKGRNKLVFGDGSPTARLMFVGEGPGADEDAQGLPFVGRAGQLLNNMIAAMGLKREECYIANIVKCRPPGNRTPEPDEANTCSPFLFRQIDVVRPQVLVALGATAATYLLGARQPLAGLRGRVHAFRGTSLIVTYHPAFLLRDPRQKKEAWADLQIAMKELGLKKAGNTD
ncbi:MAG: uracil-DNA glycosylase [Terracidiphilus sp.]